MSRKSEGFSGLLKAYESGQQPHAISLGYLLVVHSKKGACLLKGKKYATVKFKKNMLSCSLSQWMEVRNTY